MSEEIQGLPEGVQLVRIGLAGEDDFELIGEEIRKGKRALAAAGVIVKPAEGYTFQPARWFNARTYEFEEIQNGTYRAVRSTPDLELKVVARFVVQNSGDENIVREAMYKLQKLPGYVEGSIE